MLTCDVCASSTDLAQAGNSGSFPVTTTVRVRFEAVLRDDSVSPAVLCFECRRKLVDAICGAWIGATPVATPG
jgi:hypothetical protein